MSTVWMSSSTWDNTRPLTETVDARYTGHRTTWTSSMKLCRNGREGQRIIHRSSLYLMRDGRSSLKLSRIGREEVIGPSYGLRWNCVAIGENMSLGHLKVSVETVACLATWPEILNYSYYVVCSMAQLYRIRHRICIIYVHWIASPVDRESKS